MKLGKNCLVPHSCITIKSAVKNDARALRRLLKTMLNFICLFLQSRTMKLIPMILSILLAGSALGYGMQASAQNPCTASQPCTQICGNHLCAPGEVYAPGVAGSNANTTKAASQNTNQTGAPSIATQMNISANATAVMHHHGNMTGTMANGTMTTGFMGNGTMMPGNMTMGTHMYHHHGNMTGTMANGTMTTGSMSMASNLPSPNAQVTAGTQPANVKCMSGFYLVINNANSRPACVTQSTASLLEARGWGHAA
jgi:hypothetical protein